MASGEGGSSANTPVSQACLPCASLKGVTCEWNATVVTMVVLHGFWRASRFTTETAECRTAGAWTPCAAGRNGSKQGLGYCAAGYYGPKCELCERGNSYFDATAARCRTCGDIVVRLVGYEPTPGHNPASLSRPACSLCCLRLKFVWFRLTDWVRIP